MQAQQDQSYSTIYLLADWEKDIWKRVYFNLGKKADFQYTFDKNEAMEKIFPYSLGEIASTTLKMPKKKEALIIPDDTTNETTTMTSSEKVKKRESKKEQARTKSENTREQKDRGQRMPNFARSKSIIHRKEESNIFSFKVFEQDKSAVGGYDSAIDEERQPYYMRLLSKKNTEVAQLKCSELQPLKSLRDQIVSSLYLTMLTTR